MKTLHFVRHGTVHNPDGILYGRLPGFYLSNRGHLEAAAAAQGVVELSVTKQVPVQALFSSPLDRTCQTANAFHRNHSLWPGPTRRMEDLIECGQVFEGQRFPSPETLRKPSNWKYLRNPFRPSWGESYASIFSRMEAAADTAQEGIQEGAAAVLVSHQVPIVIYRRGIEGKPFFHDPAVRQCAPASVTTVEYKGGVPVSLTYHEFPTAY